MLIEEKKLPRIEFPAPFDWGLAFALTKWRELLLLAFIPAVIETALEYLAFVGPISQQQAFLFFVLALGSNCWLLVSIVLFALASFKGTRSYLRHIAAKAFSSMPKVIVSFVLLLAIVVFFFAFPPALLFALFLMWAPFFCAAEIGVPPEPKKNEEESFIFDEDDSSLSSLPSERDKRLLTNRPIWDLGYGRSVRFASVNPVVTIQLALLVWVAATLPTGLIPFLAGNYFGFEWVIVQNALSAFILALVFAVISAVFVFLLPREVISEIGTAVENPSETTRIINLAKRISFNGRLLPFVLMTIVGSATTYSTFHWLRQQNLMPDQVQFKVEKIEVTDKQIIFNVDLSDRFYDYRWLSPANFRLGFAKTLADNTKTDEEPEMFTPERVLPFDEKGNALVENQFTPHKGNLRLVLYFDNTLAAQGDRATAKYSLYHSSYFETGDPIASGDLPKVQTVQTE